MRYAVVFALMLGLAAPALADQPAPPEPTAAQAKLPTQDIVIIGKNGTRHTMTVEMALTPQQQETGLMFRTHLADNEGMLFDWGMPRSVPMWMKNTVISLDMLFVDANGRINHVVENAVPYSLAVIDSGGDARATIEVAAGLAAKWNINVGDQVTGAIFAKK